jgi:hypothetical protein
MNNRPRTQSHAALRSHTAVTAKRSAATHTRQHKAAIAILRHSTLLGLTALETAPTMSASYVARRPTTHATHIAHSHAECRHTSPTRPHDVPHSTNHCALRNHHRMHTAARTPRTARHTAPTTPHAAHRKSHPVTHAASAPHSPQRRQAAQRRRDAAGELVVVQGQPPAGHTNSHRVTPWHPTPPPTPASRPRRISAHRIASIKSSQMTSQSAHCMLSLTHNTVRE